MSYFLNKTENCLLCGSADLGLDSQLTINYWREFPLPFSDCQQCGAAFANPMPSDLLITQGNRALVRFYGQNRSAEHEYKDARQAYLRGKLFARKLRKWKSKGRLLELGCYNGFFSLGVRENCDWEVEGLEISEELCRWVRDGLGLRCHLGTLENAELPDGAYDFVICHDLIEHINRPGIFLKKLSGILKPGGRVEIITPNAVQDLSFARRAYRAGKPITMLLNHILYFAPRTLRQALERSGLAVRNLYCYDIRYSIKDFGLFGFGAVGEIVSGPSLFESLKLPERDSQIRWNASTLQGLREDPKSSLAYGIFRETIPAAFTWHVPYRLGIGHEIYCLAEKRPG